MSNISCGQAVPWLLSILCLLMKTKMHEENLKNKPVKSTLIWDFSQQQQNLFHSSLLISDFPCSTLVFMLSSLMILQNLPRYVTKAVINNVHCSLNNSQHHRAREEKHKKPQTNPILSDDLWIWAYLWWKRFYSFRIHAGLSTWMTSVDIRIIKGPQIILVLCE